MPPKHTKCFNCDGPVSYRFLCVDCWRMALIAWLLGGGSGEASHRLLMFLFP